jgi:TonB family protein
MASWQSSITSKATTHLTAILRGDPLLAEAVEQVAKQWKFKQITREGNAVPVISKVVFNFVLATDNQDQIDVVPEIAPATDFPQHVTVSQRVMAGLMLSHVNPVYPGKARAALIQGSVTMQGSISKEGKVTNLRLVSGPPELATAAIDAVQQWLYRPYLLYGRPVEVDTQMQINFALR